MALVVGCATADPPSSSSVTPEPGIALPDESPTTTSGSEQHDDAQNDQGDQSRTVAAPDWRQVASPSPAELCKVEDGLAPELLAVGRGGSWNDLRARGPVGFPWVSSYFFSPEGQIRILAMLVSFEDTERFVEQPLDFWGPQAHEIEEWSAFWSQGTTDYDVTVVDEWVELPYPSSAAPSDDGTFAADIVGGLPEGVDAGDFDAIFIYWAHGITAESRGTFGLRINSVDSRPGAQADEAVRQMIWSADQYQYEDSGRLTQRLKEESLWTYLIHEILHETNLNLHAPGNGWATGVGQNHYPTQGGGQSVSITAWEQFLLGWMTDDQVHCIAPEELVDEQTVILTPLEIYGGERRALVIPISNSDVLVVESRRPIGYSSSWSPEHRGLLAYTVNPQEPEQRDHIDDDCGNDPNHTKWAYYLFPDQEVEDPSSWCGARGGGFAPAVINEGETLTHNGVHIELVYSSEDRDYIRVSTSGEAP